LNHILYVNGIKANGCVVSCLLYEPVVPIYRLVLCEGELRLAFWLLQQETVVNHWKRKRMGFSRCISTPKANFWL